MEKQQITHPKNSDEQTMALAEALSATFKQVIEQAMTEAIKGHSDEDRLIDVKEASKLLGLSTDWIYRNHTKLPFTRKLGPRMLRFSYQGIQKHLAIRKLS